MNSSGTYVDDFDDEPEESGDAGCAVTNLHAAQHYGAPPSDGANNNTPPAHTYKSVDDAVAQRLLRGALRHAGSQAPERACTGSQSDSITTNTAGAQAPDDYYAPSATGRVDLVGLGASHLNRAAARLLDKWAVAVERVCEENSTAAYTASTSGAHAALQGQLNLLIPSPLTEGRRLLHCVASSLRPNQLAAAYGAPSTASPSTLAAIRPEARSASIIAIVTTGGSGQVMGQPSHLLLSWSEPRVTRFSADGDTVVVGTVDGVVHVYDVREPRELHWESLGEMGVGVAGPVIRRPSYSTHAASMGNGGENGICGNSNCSSIVDIILLDALIANGSAVHPTDNAVPLLPANGGKLTVVSAMPVLPVGAGLSSLLPLGFPGALNASSGTVVGGSGDGGGAGRSLSFVSVDDRGCVVSWVMLQCAVGGGGGSSSSDIHLPSPHGLRGVGDAVTIDSGGDFGRAIGSCVELRRVATTAVRPVPTTSSPPSSSSAFGPWVTCADVCAGDTGLLLAGTITGEIHLLVRVPHGGGGEAVAIPAARLRPSRFRRGEAGGSPAVLRLVSSSTHPAYFLAGYADGAICLFHVKHGQPLRTWGAPWVVMASPPPLGCPLGCPAGTPPLLQATYPRIVGLSWLPGKDGAFIAVDDKGVGTVWDFGGKWPTSEDAVASMLVTLASVGGTATAPSIGDISSGSSGGEEDILSVSVVGESALLRGSTLLYAATTTGRISVLRVGAALSRLQPGEVGAVADCLGRL